MDRVSGLEDISCNDGKTRIFSEPRRASRSLNAPTIVETARLRLEHKILEGGASGLAFKTATCCANVSFSCRSVFDFKNLDKSST